MVYQGEATAASNKNTHRMLAHKFILMQVYNAHELFDIVPGVVERMFSAAERERRGGR